MRFLMALALTITTFWAAAAAAALPGRPTAYPGMFALYAANRHQDRAHYITADFLLLAEALTFKRALVEVEDRVLMPTLERFVRGLASAVEKTAPKAPRDQAARRSNRNYLAVIQALLAGSQQAPGAPDPAMVATELERVRAARVNAKSPIAGYKMDYTRFVVRGPYARSPQAGRYFQALGYAGRVLFAAVASKATAISPDLADRLTRRALMLIRLTAADPHLAEARLKIEQVLTALVGPPDNLTRHDYGTVLSPRPDLGMREIRSALLAYARKQDRRPRVLGLPVNLAALADDLTPADVTTGWALVPARFTADSAAFQQLVRGAVGPYEGRQKPFTLTLAGGAPVKGFPLAAELMALLGSRAAQDKLHQTGEIKYRGYPEAAQKAAALLKLAGQAPGQALGIMQYWLTRGPADPSDGLRRLGACLGYWVHGRHASVLYTKQSTTPVAKGLRFSKPRPGAWLEPAAGLYRRLAKRAATLHRVTGQDRFLLLQQVFERCAAISNQILSGASLPESEQVYLNDLDRRLIRITGRTDQAIVTDVHTDANSGQVLAVAVGRPRAVFNTADSTRARGALFSFYEFKQPGANRLTDRAWQEMLADPKAMSSLRLSPFSEAPTKAEEKKEGPNNITADTKKEKADANLEKK